MKTPNSILSYRTILKDKEVINTINELKIHRKIFIKILYFIDGINGLFKEDSEDKFSKILMILIDKMNNNSFSVIEKFNSIEKELERIKFVTDEFAKELNERNIKN